MDTQQLRAKAQFESQSFFLLRNLPKGSEFGFDGKIFVVDKFEGVKFLPPSLHLFIFSAVPSSKNSGPESLSSGVGVRQGILRFFSAGETRSEEWDNKREELVGDGDREMNRPRRRKEDLTSEPEQLVSQDYLKSIDKYLAPYPAELSRSWTPLVNFISRNSLLRVIGIDARGNARVDAITASTVDDDELKHASSQTSWGKKREEIKEESDEELDELLRFIAFEKTPPRSTSGEELTRWSQDKSWSLSHGINELGIGKAAGVKEFLAELQLSFILFTLLHNFSSLAAYKIMFSLLCRSATLLQPITARRPSIYLPALLVDESLPLFASFLTILIDQFEFLDPEFFAAQMPGLDNFLLDELDHFCTALSDAALEWNQLGSEGGAGVEVWKIIVERYVKFANLTSEKFGWQLGMIKGSRATGYASQLATRSGEREHEVDIEDLEEGDDAPVIVDM